MSAVSPRGETANNNTTTPLLGETCPKCGNEEAWHGVITEPGERERFACDECGMWLALTVKKVEPPKPAKAKRPFSFTFEIDKGRLFIDWRGEHLLAFCPGRYLSIGNNWELLSSTEAEERYEQGVEAGREAGRRQAEESAA